MGDLHSSLAISLAQTNCQPGATPAGLVGHDVYFYPSDGALVDAVVEFLGEAVRVGQPVIVIATGNHRRAFAAGLRAKGLDPDQLLTGRLAIWLDARETLDSFMEGKLPNKDLFIATVGSVFEKILEQRQYLLVRAFGEMVDLLWKDGNIEGAILLEKYWNELALRYKYSLLCGYSIDNFVHEAGSAAFRRVCDQHTNALPLDVPQRNVA